MICISLGYSVIFDFNRRWWMSDLNLPAKQTSTRNENDNLNITTKVDIKGYIHGR